METWAIAAWAWTCCEESGHASKQRDGREGIDSLSDRLEPVFPRTNMAGGRRPLPIWGEEGIEVAGAGGGVNRAVAEASRLPNGHRASIEDHGVILYIQMPERR